MFVIVISIFIFLNYVDVHWRLLVVVVLDFKSSCGCPFAYRFHQPVVCLIFDVVVVAHEVSANSVVDVLELITELGQQCLHGCHFDWD